MHSVRARTTFVVLAAMLLLTASARVASAAPGDLDPTFDGDGIVITNNPGSGAPARLVPMPDGRVVASADCLGATQAQVFDFCVYRYNADGSPDITFDGDGKAQSDFGNTFDSPWAVAVQSDGKVVAAGECALSSVSSFCMARYNADGSPDTTFDDDGLVITAGFTADGGDEAYGRALAIQPDGMIVVAGFCSHNVPPSGFGIREACAARYTTTGSLDSTFSGDGRAVLDLGSIDDSVTSVGLQSTGAIVLGGSCPPASTGNFCLARLTGAGAPDGSFGVVATVVGNTNAAITDLAITPTDQIVAGGSCAPVSTFPQYLCVARYDANGSLDSGFSGDGVATVLAGGTNGGQAAGTTVALQTNGKVLAANGCYTNPFNDFCIARFNADGTVDTSFGTNGVVLTPVNPTGNNDWATDVAVAANGKVLAAGACAYPMCIARYGGDPVTDTSAPQITISIDPADTEAATGWYNAATSGTNGVLVHVSAQDDTAVTNVTCTDGVTTVLNSSSASGSFTLGAGNHSITCTASDGVNPPGAGTGSTAMPVLADVDQVPPTVACVSEPWLQLHQSVASLQLADISDATSGPTITQYFVSTPDTSTVGLHPTAIGIDDVAGNVTNTSCSYRVIYTFAGFAAPISTGTYEYINAVTGSAIPFRFRLLDFNSQPVNGLTSVTVTESAGSCIGTSYTLAKGDYSKGKVGLVSLGNGSYEFRWKAPRSDRGQCRLVGLTFPDGMTYAPGFKFAP